MASQGPARDQETDRRTRPQERAAERGRLPESPARPLPDLADADLALPANTLVRGQVLYALQRTMGNQALQQALLSPGGPVQQALPPGVVARVPTTTTQAIAIQRPRAGTPGAPWAELSPDQRRQVEGHIRGRAHGAAVRAVWDALRGGLPEAGRMEVQMGEPMGQWGGVAIAPAASDFGVTLIYVPRRPECAGLAPAAHLQLHGAADLRFLVQINASLFAIDPEEAVSRLQTTLMHEYVHVEQQVARGIEANFALRAIGDREFITQTGATTAASRELEALDEIEAPCAEIENAERTGLALSYDLRTAINLAWSNYRTYFGLVNGQPDRAVATRVYQGIQRGRRLFAAYLRSSRAAWMQGGQRLIYSNTPSGYDEQLLLPFLNQPAAPATAPVTVGAPGTTQTGP